MNWMRLVSRAKRLGQRAHQERLRHAWHALEQHVTAAQQRDDETRYRGVLAHDGLAHLRADVGESA